MRQLLKVKIRLAQMCLHYPCLLMTKSYTESAIPLLTESLIGLCRYNNHVATHPHRAVAHSLVATRLLYLLMRRAFTPHSESHPV